MLERIPGCPRFEVMLLQKIFAQFNFAILKVRYTFFATLLICGKFLLFTFKTFFREFLFDVAKMSGNKSFLRSSEFRIIIGPSAIYSRPQSSTVFFNSVACSSDDGQKFEFFDWPFNNKCATTKKFSSFYA